MFHHKSTIACISKEYIIINKTKIYFKKLHVFMLPVSLQINKYRRLVFVLVTNWLSSEKDFVDTGLVTIYVYLNIINNLGIYPNLIWKHHLVISKILHVFLRERKKN